MTAFSSLQSAFMRLRRIRLSSFVVVLFAVALVLPWLVFAWLSITSRAT